MTKEEQNQFYKSLGESIKSARKDKLITQEILSNQLGLSRVSIVNIENGKQKVLLHTLVEIADYLGVNITELLGNSVVNNLDQVIDEKVNRRALNSGSADILKAFSKLYSKE